MIDMIMRFQDLVKAHIKWREDLTRSMGVEISAKMIDGALRDDVCEIGQWFYVDGQRMFSHIAEFSAAKEAHLLYHQAVARSLSENQTVGADDEFDVMIEAFNALNKVIGHLK